jgi:hypothetical protein
MPNPRRPVPSNSKLAGSRINIAPLFAVAQKRGFVAVPSLKNPTMYDPVGSISGGQGPLVHVTLRFSSGDTFGLWMP